MWEEYQADGEGFISMDRWGKDHWSVLAYAETCAVDAHGVLANAKMRCNSRLHRVFVYVDGLGVMHDGAAYPTRLKNETQDQHDDWSCLEDLAAAGYVKIQWRNKYRGNSRVFGDGEARITLTPQGLQVSSELRNHKAGGGNFADFLGVQTSAATGMGTPKITASTARPRC